VRRRTAAGRVEVLESPPFEQRVVVSWAQVLAWMAQVVMGWVVGMKRVLVLVRAVQRAEVMVMMMAVMGWAEEMRVLVLGREVQRVEEMEIHSAWDSVVPVSEQAVKQVELHLTMVVQVTVQVVVNRWV
jgi:hypothetical protein